MKSVKLTYWIFCAFAFAGILSCSLTGNDKETIINVNEEFTINLNELLDSPRQLIFDLKSVESEPCMNSSIINFVRLKNGTVTLLINGIEPATDCNPGEAPASASPNVGFLSNGIYDINITVRNTLTNEGKLTVTDHRYEVNMESSDGIAILNNIMIRIPSETIWGYTAYDDENLVGNLPQDFLQDLESLTQPKHLGQGYYGSFEIETNGDLKLKSPPAYNHVNTFFYKFDGNEEQLKDLLENYRSGINGSDMELAIYTSNGGIL